MNSKLYFSEREESQRLPTSDYISDRIWYGIRSLIQARINDGSFGARYPTMCFDGREPTGTDESQFLDALLAEVPNLDRTEIYGGFERKWDRNDLFDSLEFCWNSIGKPIERSYHDYLQHRHLTFDVDTGREEFREEVNRIFQVNGLIFKFSPQGSIQRLVSPVVHKEFIAPQFRTGDDELDNMLEIAQQKILNHDDSIRYEALKELWDAWERLKTTVSGPHKKKQIELLLDQVAGTDSPKFRETLEKEAKELTCIGNRFHIRHSETNQERLDHQDHIDYLFYRLFALVRLILQRCM